MLPIVLTYFGMGNPPLLPSSFLALGTGFHSDAIGDQSAFGFLNSKLRNSRVLPLLFSDNVDGRALPIATAVTGQVTIESCTTACFNTGYQFSGAEYAEYAHF